MTETAEHKKVRVRSPAYPAIDLKTAISKAEIIWKHEKRTAAPVAVVTKHCGLDIKSSGAQRLISALKQFGLVVEHGGGDDRKVKLSDRALDILLADPDDAPRRTEAIKAAALSPKIHKNLWDHYNGELPSDATLRAYLLRDLEFNDSHVDSFIKEFRSTVGFAKLAGSDILPPADEDDDANEIGGHRQEDQENRRQRRRPMQAGTTEDVLNLPDEGQIVIQMPQSLSKEGFEDFESWLQLIIRKAKRSIQQDVPEQTVSAKRRLQEHQRDEEESGP
jgi:hypothetical protein